MSEIKSARGASARGGVRPFVLFLTLLFLLSVLSACATIPPEVERQRLENRIESVSVSDCETVADCLAKWRFPKGYDAKKLEEAEKRFRDNYYRPLATVSLAKETANAFMALYYEQDLLADREAYTDALIRSLVFATGDDYGVYRTAEEYASYISNMSGTSGGVGITVRKNYEEGTITVVRVVDDSPARRAGVRSGDILHSVEGLLVTAETIDEAFEKMQGEVGSLIRFSVLRGDQVVNYELVRESLSNLTVSYSMLEGKIAYIAIYGFKQNTFDYFKKALDEAEAAGAVGFIFDVRSNPGGYLSSIWNILDYLAPKDTELFSYGTAGEVTAYFSDDEHQLSVPCVVLCSEGTASAGELFTSALRDFNAWGLLKATVIGVDKTTFGKGIMQGSFRLSDGSYLTLTTAYYNPPSGENYHGVGIFPDIVCEDESQIMDVAREELLSLISGN